MNPPFFQALVLFKERERFQDRTLMIKAISTDPECQNIFSCKM